MFYHRFFFLSSYDLVEDIHDTRKSDEASRQQKNVSDDVGENLKDGF